jgi:hypothetical protein
MTNLVMQTVLVALISMSPAVYSDTFELATIIEESNGVVLVDAYGYTKMNLIRMEIDHVGEVTLNGAVSVEAGQVNVVLWAKVGGKYYFSKLPGLQGFDKGEYADFAIPFSSPDSPITEIVLDVELPAGGRLQIKDLELIEG